MLRAILATAACLGMISTTAAEIDRPAVTVIWVYGPVILPTGEELARFITIHNLRTIGMAAMEFAQRHDGRMPKSLEELVLELDLPGEIFISPRVGLREVPESIRRDRVARARWVDTHADYEWVAGDLMRDMPAELMWAHEVPTDLKGGIAMLFCDGYAEVVPEARVSVHFWQTDQIRQTLGLP
jgi:hypothetical protein